MPGFELYFESKPKAITHPRVRFWQQMKKQGARLMCELIREPDAVSFGPARLHVRFVDRLGKDMQSPDQLDWDAYLDDELIRMGVSAVTLENEAKRFGLALRDRLQTLEQRFGYGYFNAVLIDYIEESPFAEVPLIQGKCRFIQADRPGHAGRSFDECRATIEAVIVRCARDLTALGYDQQQAVQILSGAVAEYLDERFSITSQQLIGLA